MSVPAPRSPASGRGPASAVFTTGRPPGAWRQVAALLRLRAAGVRRRRVPALLALLLIPLVLVAGTVGGASLPSAQAGDALLLTPSAWAGYALAIAVASATSGARSLITPAQAVAFWVRPRTEHFAALVLAPLNAAWVVQTAALLMLTGWVFTPQTTGTTNGTALLGAALVLTVLWVLACSSVAVVLGWVTELARTTRAGTWLVRGVMAAGVAAGGVLVLLDRFDDLLDRLPTIALIDAVTATGDGGWAGWAACVVLLVAVTAVATVGGEPLVRAVRRRTPRDQSRLEAGTHPPAALPAGALAAQFQLDRIGVWRSAPLRRGLITLAVVPGAAAALAGLEWTNLVLLPGLAASGAGLLFGINMLALDGSGAVWRASLPGDPRTWFVARLLVVAGVCGFAALVAAVVGGLRAPGAPLAAEVAALVGATSTCTLQVVGRCARWSVRHPHPAPMRHSRDHPAPPGAMAGYSARLAVVTTLTGSLFVVCAQSRQVMPSVVVTLVLGGWALRHLVAALRRWEDPVRRSTIVTAVAA
jgi:hypothetical protein